jgi:hypothetical protein
MGLAAMIKAQVHIIKAVKQVFKLYLLEQLVSMHEHAGV